ncbi:hypothetical protein [Polaromonas hydrogenivorans]|uniref:HNH endonuclease n=1 Tax=Polaromonas hydrogenivorans TaxID=335476 RepID=A0AAU7LSP5_9BURK
MEQLRDYSDERLLLGCIYCGAQDNTREHVPSRVLLDKPYPENLPVVGACHPCNNGFSKDEEYVACLIESVIAGAANPAKIRRPSIAALLERSPVLRERIESSKTLDGNKTVFEVEHERVRRVLLKLARCHAAYELKQECREEPISIWWQPLELLTEQFLEEFNAPHVIQTYGEIGSRGMQRLRVAEVKLAGPNGEEQLLHLILNDWVDVQEGRYRYHAIDDGGLVRIKIVIGEYLASEAAWEI